MTEKKDCARCGEKAEEIDNILDYSFWGLIQQKTEITTRRSVRIASVTIRHKGRRALRADEEMTLCDPCWGLLVGRFMQGRDVVAVEHEHDWRPMPKHPLDRCALCYVTRIATDRPICTCASAYGEFIGCKLHGIDADNTNRPNGSER